MTKPDLLKGITRDLLDQAKATPGDVKRFALSRGLRIDVKVEGRIVYLQLSRTDRDPSDEEWRIVLRHWPDPIPADEVAAHLSRPAARPGDDRKYLRSFWTIYHQINLL